MEKKRILKQECKINTAEISMSRVLRIGEGISIRLKGKGWWRIGDFRKYLVWFDCRHMCDSLISYS